jgi:uncharacterized membrane protein YphA (DoxX/SURF4 family)
VTLSLTELSVAAIYLVSGLAKVTARDSVRPFVEGLGIPRGLARYLNTVISAVEIVLAVLLALGIAVRWTAIGAAFVAAGFLAAHAVARLRGSAVSCRCFGVLDTEMRPLISGIRAGSLCGAAIIVAILAGSSPAKAGGMPADNGFAVLSGLMIAITYILIFHLINETAGLVSRDRDIHRSLTAAARRLDRG